MNNLSSLLSAAELDLLLGGLSTSREGRLSNEDRLFMSIPPSPASGAKKPSSGDQVLALKRDEKKGRKKKPMLTGQKLQLIRTMEEQQLKQKQEELAQHQQKMREAEQRLAEEQQSMFGLQAEVDAMSPDEEMVTNDSSIVDAQINIQVVRAAQAMEARCPESPRLLGCHLPLD